MSDYKLTKEEQEELDKLQKEIVDEAKKVVEDYADNPSELSGSSFHIDYDSSFLDEGVKGEGWKKITKPEYLKDLIKSRKKKRE
tara:strand:- start:45 stop:296 length:252 start_codon:yes stop_codon:yes gene_type:complete